MEFIIIFPIVLLVFFGAVQTAVTYVAGNAAQAAANAAYSQARTLTGTTAAALSAGYELLEGRGDITGAEISVQRTATATLKVADPTWHEGLIVATTDREGATTRWLVESVTDELAPAEKIATTKLSLVELREAS